MTNHAVPVGGDEFDFLTELLASDELWTERAAEAATLAGAITESRSPIVVLVGPRGAGKTELLRRWVIPHLSQRLEVIYRDSCEVLDQPSPHRGETIEVFDAFERCLTEERTGDLVRALSSAAGARRKIVLCIGDEALSQLFELIGAIPQLRGEVLQVPLLAGERVADSLQKMSRRYGVAMNDSFCRDLAADLNALPPAASIGVELIAILVFQFRRAAGDSHELGHADYVKAGGLNGILEGYFDLVVERSPEGIDPQLAWAVTQEVAALPTVPTLDLDEVARRFGVPKEQPWHVVDWLQNETRVLRQSDRGGYDVVPPQLAAAILEKARREALAFEPIRALLQQGVRNFSASESLLPAQRFRRVHGHRTAIKVTDKEARLMLRCALAYDDPHAPAAIDYWLQRITTDEGRVEVLLDASFDQADGVRRQAVKRLAGMNEPEIRNQLHLLALRDGAPEVRAAAVGALDEIKDPHLKRSLLQEISDVNSPYRLRAIEALRVFTAPDATDGLVDIVRKNAPLQDQEARRKAIEVLGAQNTARAADALLEIGLHDADADDRAGAASALGRLVNEGLLAEILEKLRCRRAEASRVLTSVSRPALLWSVLYGSLAAIAIVANLSAHGVLLALMRRWRLAAAIFACEALGLLLLWTESGSGVAFFLASFLLGLLIPMRLLLHERLDLKPQSWFERSLAGVLFGVCSVSFFALMHGLPSMIARRMRLGLVLFGFQTLGLFFVMTWLYIYERYAGLMQGQRALLVIGLAVLVVSYVRGVGTVFVEAFLMRNRRAAIERIDAICSELLQSPAVSDRVLQHLAADSPTKARWSKELVHRFGERMQKPLINRWATADEATRKRIFMLLMRRRDVEALQFLRQSAPSLGWSARLRAGWAEIAFRLSVWPRPLLVAMALIFYAPVAIAVSVVTILESAPDALLKIVQDQKKSLEERTEAVSRLLITAQQTQDHEVANDAVTNLTQAATHDLPDPLRQDVLNAVVLVAARSEKSLEVIDGIATLLKKSDMQLRTIDALARIGSPYAALKLAEFIKDRLDFALGGRIKGPSRDEAIAAAQSALDALENVQESGADTIRLLKSLATSSLYRSSATDPIAAELMIKIGKTAEKLDPLSRAEYFLAEQNFDAAIDAAGKVDVKPPADDQRAIRQREILARAYASRGALAMARAFASRDALGAETGAAHVDRQDDESAKRDLYGALDAGAGELVPGEILSLGLQLAFRFHEVHGPRDPGAFAVVYDILTKIQPLAQEPALRQSVLANLAESCLTTGRYEDAIRIAQELATARSSDPSTVLNMKYILFVALTLKGDLGHADATLKDVNALLSRGLPEDLQNTWTYSGTKSYIEHVAEQRAQGILLQTMTRVAPGF